MNDWGLKFKNENQDNDAVTDAVAASAYVEQFATEIFSRAEAAMRANKVTKFVAPFCLETQSEQRLIIEFLDKRQIHSRQRRRFSSYVRSGTPRNLRSPPRPSSPNIMR